MLKFLFTLFIFLVINLTSYKSQAFNGSSFQNIGNNLDYNDNYQNNKFNNSNSYSGDSLNSENSSINRKKYYRYDDIYQGKGNNAMSGNYIDPISNDYNQKTEFNNPKNYNYEDSLITSIPQPNTKKYQNFKDGKGKGYRVYDNSNRQSYFCNIDPIPKKTFTHDNNFNGVYVGAGIAKIDSSINFSQTSVDNSFGGPGGYVRKIIDPYKFNFSGSKVLPSIIIGQGRLFSSGLFLGQEFAMNLGEFNIGSNKINNNEYKKINYSFSNYSYYSGKFGFNIFKIFLPYVKLSLSTSASRFILEKNDNSKVVSGGSFPSVGFGGGIDISIQDHVRAIIDYTQFSGSGDAYFVSSKSNNLISIRNSVAYDSKYAFTRVSLIYRF
jgi:hypothetical protein